MSATTSPAPTTGNLRLTSQPSAQPLELTPVLSQKYAANWKHAIVCLWFVVLVMYTNHAPLLHTEVWRNASLGRWINNHAALPTTHPSVPLADGMPQANAAWLSQVIISRTLTWSGAEALSTLATLVVLIVLAAWAVQFFRASGQKRFMLGALSLLAAAWFAELNAPGPRLAGGLCFVVLLGLVSRAAPWRVLAATKSAAAPIASTWQREHRLSPARWGTVVLVMALWANLDPSFVVGLGVLLAVAVGQIVAAARADRRWQNPFAFRQVQTWIWLCEVGLLATLVNPHGAGLWRAMLRRAGNPLWHQCGGFLPLRLASTSGIIFVLLWIAIVFVWRRSRLPIVASEIFALGLLSILVATNANFLIWLAPVMILVGAKHWRAIVKLPSVTDRKTNLYVTPQRPPQPLNFAWSLVCLLLVWVGIALSPMSTPLLGGTVRTAERRHTRDTPLAAAAFLRTSDVCDTIWAPSYWADWLIWDGPAEAKFYTDSHVWNLPRRSQADYSRIYQGNGNWQRVADRYAIHTLVVDKQKQMRLASQVMRSGNKWKLLYEDDQAMVLSRVGI